MSHDYIYEDDRVTPFLDLEQLKKEERRPHQIRKKIYKMILAKCHDKIRKINKTTEARECKYEIPWFIYGYPGYDLEDVNSYLIHQLSLNGLFAERINAGTIYISWKKQDVDPRQFRIQAQKMTNKPNLYKVNVSPLADDPNVDYVTPPGSKKPHVVKEDPTSDDHPVTMLKYDDRFDDLVPVNTKKVPHMYPKQPPPEPPKPRMGVPGPPQAPPPSPYMGGAYPYATSQSLQQPAPGLMNPYQIPVNNSFQAPPPQAPPSNRPNYYQNPASYYYRENPTMVPTYSQPRPNNMAEPKRNPDHAKNRYATSRRKSNNKKPQIYRGDYNDRSERYRYDQPRDREYY